VRFVVVLCYVWWLLMSAVLRHRRSHWFHTIAMSRTELDRVFNNTAMKKRCVVAIPGSCPAYAAQDTTIRGSRHVALIHFRRPAAYRLSSFGAKHAHRVRASERRQRPSKNGISLPHLTPPLSLTPFLRRSASGSVRSDTQAWVTTL
jgi:hypothetical protein